MAPAARRSPDSVTDTTSSARWDADAGSAGVPRRLGSVWHRSEGGARRAAPASVHRRSLSRCEGWRALGLTVGLSDWSTGIDTPVRAEICDSVSFGRTT